MDTGIKVLLFQIAHGAICGLFAAAIPALLFGTATPFLTILITTYCLLGNAKYGTTKMSSRADMKAALVASVIWPYLAWKQYDKELQELSDIIYDAWLNSVHVGTITEVDYNAIKRRVLHDPRVYVAQTLNAGKMLSKTLDSFVIGVPMLAFWGMLVLAYADPTVYSGVLTIIQDPEAIRKAASLFVMPVLVLWSIAYSIQFFVLGRIPGFENKFDQQITRLLRMHLKVAAEGGIALGRPRPNAIFEM